MLRNMLMGLLISATVVGGGVTAFNINEAGQVKESFSNKKAIVNQHKEYEGKLQDAYNKLKENATNKVNEANTRINL